MKMRYKVLGFLVVLSIITYLDRVCMNVVSKYVKADLELNNQQFGYILGAFSLAYAFFELPTGILGDIIGPRRVLTRVVLWWSGFTALTGSAFNFTYLLIVRFLFGVGEAGAYPNSSIAIARWFPAHELGRAQAAIWSAARIGGALTPLLVIPLVHAVGWRFAFVVLGGVGTVWALAWYFWFRDEPSEKPGITQQEAIEIETTRKATQSHRIDWKKVIVEPNILYLMLMAHLFFYASYFFTNWSATYFQEGRGLSEEDTKKFISLSYFLGAMGCLIGGFLSDWLVRKRGLRFGRRVVAGVGLGVSALLFLFAGLTADNQLAGYLLAICVFSKDLALPVAFVTCVDIGKQNSGTVTGTMNFAGQLGGFFITIIFGIIVNQTNNFQLPLFLIAGCLLVSALLWLKIDPEKSIN